MKILSIESSCDETAAAITEDGRKVLSSVIATQIDEHKLYGGVVPEIASRRHCENITGVCAEALEKADMTLDDVDAVAVTNAPRTYRCSACRCELCQGTCTCKEQAAYCSAPHKGHIAANYITHPELEPPYLCLVVSGGHSHIVKVNSYTELETVGKTTDDAAGEAFDKAARAMGFPYPGGVHIDRAAKQGDAKMYKLPRPATKNPYDFSFSGLKTAVINLIHNNEQKGIETDVNSLAACFQDTITSILAEKFMAAANELGYTKLALAGGVAANSMLRDKLSEMANASGKQFYMPDISLCGDNAAMIGCQGYYEYLAGNIADMSLNAYATKKLQML